MRMLRRAETSVSRRILRPLVLATALAACAAPPRAQEGPAGPDRPSMPGRLPSIEEKTRGTRAIPGFLPLYWDESAGKLWVEVPRLEQELLYVTSLAAGLGSNDVGLDRSQLGSDRLVLFRRVGPKVLLVQPNLAFRAVSESAAERRAVEESFAQSVLWGFTVAAETGERVLVDATDFALRDAHDVIGALRRSNQGTYRLDVSRSAPYLPRTRAFPRNSEIEVTLTFTGDQPGRFVREVTPTPEAITVRQRHSFIALPEPGFEPRESDPRGGFFGIRYVDYATPLGQPVVKRYIARHRLQKKDPSASASEAVAPIVYYLDPGVPEPMRSALLDGARWWNEAFEAAGYRDAFRVEVLPDTADPMDVRYNVIQWVHRSTRGWSYGSSVVDPRTGEIIKGHVLLGSLRVRQDYLLAEGLLAPYETGAEADPRMREMALARLRQLSAHEVGHTLGIAHNYVASTAGRASVMDYPHPLVKLTAAGEVDLSDAYATGIGDWDRVAITWGYQDFPAGADEDAALDAILDSARMRGLLFLTDQDARGAGAAHPRSHLWDNGVDAAEELERVLAVRRAALERFGERAIRRGEPLATIEEALVPLYLHHRYQTEAAAKVVGGQYYSYAMRGVPGEGIRPAPAAEQRRALRAMLRTLSPAELTLPEHIVALIPPRPYTYEPHRELFRRWTGPTFDAVAPAAAAAELTLSLLLHPERAARLVEQNALDGALPGFRDVLDALRGATFERTPAGGLRAEVARAVQRVVADRMMALAAEAPMPQVRAEATAALEAIAAVRPAGTGAWAAHSRLLAADVRRFLDRPAEAWQPPRAAPEIPPGQPIGSGSTDPLYCDDGG